MAVLCHFMTSIMKQANFILLVVQVIQNTCVNLLFMYFFDSVFCIEWDMLYAQVDSLELFVRVNCGNVGMETVGMVSLPSLELRTVVCPQGFLAQNLVQCRCPMTALLFQLIVLV